jgi:hypothetical protein
MLRLLMTATIVVALPVVASAECLTTIAPALAFVPPAPLSAISPWASRGGFWYGTDWLWTNVAFDWTWRMRNNVGDGRLYRTKLQYWSKTFDARIQSQPELTVTGKRLDREAPLVLAERANPSPTPNFTVWMTAINIQAAGCWEISSSYEGHTLTFVVSVQP